MVAGRSAAGIGAALILAALLGAGCEGRSSERVAESVGESGGEAASSPPGASVRSAGSGAISAGAAGALARAVPRAVRRVDRRAAELDDAAEELFPHDEHRGTGCQTCHQRPATHVTHRDAACTACHGGPVESSRLGEEVGGRRCDECHHASPRSAGCTICHDPTGIGGRSMATEVRVAGGAGGGVVRNMPFDHAEHGTAGCTACHTESATRGVGVACSSCHQAHHRPDAGCATCHSAGAVAAHDRGVHQGCGGSGCHEDATVLALPHNRNLCLACHQAQIGHQADEECSACHVGAAGSGARGEP